MSTNTFLESISRVGESSDWYGVPYEMWGEVPLQRERLLGLAQRSVNRGKTKVRSHILSPEVTIMNPPAGRVRVWRPTLGGADGEEDAGV